MWEAVTEFIALLLSSAGITGTFITAIFTYMLKKAKADADEKRKERLSLEIMRLEGEEKLSKLLFTLLRYSRNLCGDKELSQAEEEYAEYMEKTQRLKNEIIGKHTSN